jgi:REP element-mobilizing transposase RayT
MKRGRSGIDDSTYPLFITTTLTGFARLFTDSEYARVALRLMEQRRAHHGMTIHAYALMPSHLHAIVKAPVKGETSRFMASWKSLTAQAILAQLSETERIPFAAAARRYGEPQRKQHKLWMSRFDDLALYDSDTFAVKLEYVHHNPVKAGLVISPADFEFSSARFYELGTEDSFVTLTDCRPLLVSRGTALCPPRAGGSGQPKG